MPDDGGELVLRFWRDEFYSWRGSHWRALDESALTAQLYEVLGDASYVGSAATPTELPWRPNVTKINHVLHALKSVVLRDYEIEPDDSSGAGISFANGVLDLSTRVLKPHSPTWFNLGALPYDYDPDAPTPVAWLAFLDSLWHDGTEIDLLQEWMGYLVSGRVDMQKMLFLIGTSGAGKGVILHVCEALVGSDNHTGLKVEHIAGNFGLEQAVGKSLITLGDARFTSRNARDAVENLLSMSGGDTVRIDRKNRQAWVGVLPGRFMISTNEPPNIPDAASAMERRTLLLYFTETFKANPDRGLYARLVGELPSILNWSLVGYDRLVSAGANVDNWTAPEASEAIKAEIEELGAPVKAFMRECCRPVQGASTTKGVLYEAWSRWCDDNGKHPTSSPVFFRDLYAAYPKLRPVRARSGQGSGAGGQGSRLQAVGGVRLVESTKTAGDLR